MNLPTLMGFPPPRNVEVATAATVSMRIQLKSSSMHSFHAVLDIHRGSTKRGRIWVVGNVLAWPKVQMVPVPCRAISSSQAQLPWSMGSHFYGRPQRALFTIYYIVTIYQILIWSCNKNMERWIRKINLSPYCNRIWLLDRSSQTSQIVIHSTGLHAVSKNVQLNWSFVALCL